MTLSNLDFALLGAFFLLSLLIGVFLSKKSGSSSRSFFLSDSNMPWWLLGVSMVATTFAVDTPNLVSGIIRKDGVAGNWVWWSFLLTGMLTVFFYAKLWRKSGITTDLEFYEMRYSGKSAAFLRGFRAIYLGVFFNVVIMANVCVAAIKIGHVMFGFSKYETLLIASVITVLYSMLGGLKGVIVTDFVQFIIAMVGSIWASIYIVNLPQIGSLDVLFSNDLVQSKTAMMPDFGNPAVFVPIFLVPLAVQWWSVWYPGSEPGGGGYIAQRMLAAKNEKHATWAVLFFNFAHYAIRPWPWIVIGLASLIVFPDLTSLQSAFSDLDPSYIKDDLSYPAMLTFLPSGLLGLVFTSLVAAFMSTISTHLNWGSSYVVNDFYVRFLDKNASEKSKVAVGRVATFLLMIFAALIALYVLEDAKESFDLLLQIGAGTGLLFILRWFWSRINPYSEIAGMVISFAIALLFFVDGKMETPFFDFLEDYQKLIVGVVVTTLGWVITSLVTKPSKQETLDAFNEKIFGGEAKKLSNFKYKITAFFVGTIAIYCALFAIGNFIYGNLLYGWLLLLVFVVSFILIYRMKKYLF
ncbi:sodium:solute symporter family protein [Neptunitalea lumnitzerae]|uniref:Sodium/glucose cotransporter n=1 Tax=Neptunitalea lumnitzerae TaxID=2965509 RepID=A0ABQ5MML8_9FLAO|nr:sodium:solute symporter family protein [Neptunitalea sp. Y10]GLB50202.1 sodium/glucose cotransporter [Neptunitalea sp. Y10]